MYEVHAMPGHLIRRLQQIAVSVFTERVTKAGFDITPVQFAALSTIAENPGLDQASLAGLIAYDRVTIGGVVAGFAMFGQFDHTWVRVVLGILGVVFVVGGVGGT